MNNIAIGQYYHVDSLIHRLDGRTKIISLLFLMTFIFVIPHNNFYLLGGFAFILLIIVLLSKVSFGRFLRSLRQIIYLLVFSFIFQIFFNQEGNLLYTINQSLTIINIGLSVVLAVIYFLIRKYLPYKLIWLILLLVIIIYLFTIPMGKPFKEYKIIISEGGLLTGSFIVGRILLLIILSTLLTLTTKPTDLNNALEWCLKPFSYIGIPTSILAMMISIALRFIPTLFIETEKILKAQASRGVDFTEGKFKEKIVQIISLLVPMFIISFKRGEDLADAMEARGYIPGAERTKLNVMKFRLIDYFLMLFSFSILLILILYRVL